MKLQLPTEPRRRRATVGAAFLAIAVLMSASIFATGPNAAPEQRVERAWPVTVQHVQPQRLNPSFSAFGRVESNDVAKLRTDLIARVESVHVNEGDWVEAGDVLVQLAADELRLQLAERKADLMQHQATLRSIETEFELTRETTGHYESMHQVAQNKLTRHQDLMAQRLISQSLLDEVIAQASQAAIGYQNHMRALADFPNRIAAQAAMVDKVAALVARTELDLEKTTVTAPFAGPVLAVLVAAGDRSSLGAPLIEMADSAGFEVRVQVPDVYAARFREYLANQRAVLASGPDATRLTLSRIAGRVRQGQSGLDAFFTIEVNPGQPIPTLGRVVETNITLPPEDNVVALPAHALYESDRIYQVLDNRLHALSVQRVGDYEDAEGHYRVLIRTPELAPGDQVITTQLPKAISGLLVEPVNS